MESGEWKVFWKIQNFSIIEAECDIWFCVDKYGVWVILMVCFSILKGTRPEYPTTDEIGRCAGILHISVRVLYFASMIMPLYSSPTILSPFGLFFFFLN